ncbi:MAG: thioredoxin domain-containing protein [Nonomuraea sp.]|nr:thioredoxin domain-containing protein [Nonomuraea sp.]NUP60819.1 thioredoxin domain-containing protein [Nonomuraea sp.]NUP76226.1 thioredoxin domain-containing protein [Nonomuraea sp.]NUS01297.1 thioredoxin domain-containing protein [Nonomuraea sp.]
MNKAQRTKGERGKSAREKIREQQAAAAAQERRRRLVTLTTVGVVAAAAVGFGAWYLASSSKSEDAAAALPPVTLQPDGSAVMAKAGVTKPVVDIFEDFQCPVCKELERVSGQTFKNLAAEGKAKVVYHPITIFSREPTRSNSVRAASAARCVADGKQWIAFHDLLFKNQPAETVEGFKTDQLIEWGKEAGVTSPDFESCVTSQKHASSVLADSDKIAKAQSIEGTPTVKLNGTNISEQAFTPRQLRDAVTKAAK